MADRQGIRWERPRSKRVRHECRKGIGNLVSFFSDAHSLINDENKYGVIVDVEDDSVYIFGTKGVQIYNYIELFPINCLFCKGDKSKMGKKFAKYTNLSSDGRQEYEFEELYDSDEEFGPENDGSNYSHLSNDALMSLERNLKKQIHKERYEENRKEAEVELCYVQREIQLRKVFDSTLNGNAHAN